MKARKILCMVLSLMLMLTAFSGIAFAEVSQSPYTQEQYSDRNGTTETGFYSDYDGIIFKVGEPYLFDAYVADEDFGSELCLYAGDVELESTTEKLDTNVYRFEGFIPAAVPIGDIAIKLVTENAAGKTVRDSFSAKVVSTSSVVERIHNFDLLMDGENVTEGTALSKANSGISNVPADIFTYTAATVGANATPKIKVTDTNSTSVRALYDVNPAKGGVHEVEFDWYPITPGNSFIGLETTPNNYKFDLEKDSAHYKAIQNNVLVFGDGRTLEQRWYHVVCRAYLEPELKFEFYMDGELVGKGDMLPVPDKSSTLTALRIDVGCMKKVEETIDICYLDNLVWRNYQYETISATVDTYKIGSALFEVEDAVIPAPATEVTATLSKALIASGAYVENANGEQVSGARVTVNGENVKANFSSALSAGEYKIVIPATATYEDGTTVVGSNIEIPFEAYAKFLPILPAGGTYDLSAPVKIKAYVPDMTKTVVVFVDGAYVATLTATNNFVEYDYNASALELGDHVVKFKYDDKYSDASFTLNHAVSTDYVALKTFDKIGENAYTAAGQGTSGKRHVSQSAIVDGNGSKAMAAFVKHTLDSTDDSTAMAPTKNVKSHLTTLHARESGSTRENTIYVIEEDLWFGNANDTYWYECSYNKTVPANTFYLYKDNVLTPVTSLNRPYWNTYILQNGKIGNMVVESETWYSIKTVFDFVNSKYYIYVDGNLVTDEAGIDLSYINITGNTYYYNTTGGEVTVANSTKISQTNVNEIIGPVNGISGINGYHQFASTVAYNAHNHEGFEAYYKVLMRDNHHSYTQIPVPSIVSFNENAPEGTTALNITLDAPFDAASVASKENIKVYADGVEIPYASAAIEGNVVTVTLAEGAKANTKLDVMLLDTLLLKDGATAAGATSRATFYVTKNDIYLGTKVTFADGKANAKLFCKNYGQAGGNVLAALSGKATNELKALDIDEFVLADGFELDLSIDAAECETVLVTIWNNMVPLTVADPIAVVK